jgi:hypothetical protein
MFGALNFAGLVVAPLMISAPRSMKLTDRDPGLSDDPNISASDTMNDVARLPYKPTT